MSQQADWFENLILPLEGRMLNTLWRILRNADDIDDAQQEAMVRIWRARNQISRHANPTAMVLRICTHCALDALRKRRRWRNHEDVAGYENILADPTPSASERLAHEENAARILRAVRRLPSKQAEALMLRALESLTYEEIAEALGCSSQTARSHVSHARANLSRALQQPSRMEG